MKVLVSFTFRPLYTQGEGPLSNGEEDFWASDPVGTRWQRNTSVRGRSLVDWSRLYLGSNTEKNNMVFKQEYMPEEQI
jgi:hypothetical protein